MGGRPLSLSSARTDSALSKARTVSSQQVGTAPVSLYRGSSVVVGVLIFVPSFEIRVSRAVVDCNYLREAKARSGNLQLLTCWDMTEPRSGCPVNATVEAFGDRWTLLVLRDVMFGNRRHFNELLTQSEEGIASNILADRLRRLVAAGLLTREQTRRGQKATYSLTEAAIQLVPVFAELGAWGVRHRPTSPELRERSEALTADGRRRQFMDDLRKTHLSAAAT